MQCSPFAKKYARGYTLIEALFYITLSAIILLVISSLLYIISQSQTRLTTITMIEDEARLVIHHLSQSVRGSDLVQDPSSGFSSDTLTLHFPNTAPYSTLTYSVIDEQFIVQHPDNSISALTTPLVRVTDFEVRHLQSGSTSGLHFSFLLSTQEDVHGSFSHEKTVDFFVQQRK
jgi:hypothetical protein